MNTVPLHTSLLRSYTDFEIWIGTRAANSRGQYPVQVVVSPDGYGAAIMDLDIDADEFKSELARVCSRESNLPLRQQFGQRLFNALFVDDVRDRWKGSIGRVKGSARPIGLRLLLKILDADLAILPWELLYDPEAGAFLGATANQTVARFLPMAEPKGFHEPEHLRVLLIIQSPQPGLSEKLLPIPEEEIAALEQTMTALSAKGIEFKVMKNTPTTAIFEELQNQDYHVLHYLGHGGAGELYLVAESGDAFTPIEDTAFAYFFLGRPSIRLVVLNACSSSQVEGAGLFSGIGPALVRASIPAVVAMQYEAVYTDTASLFSQRFYAGLARGLPVDVAVNEARQFLFSKHLHDRDWSTPVLYMGTRSGHVLSLPGAGLGGVDQAQLIEALKKVTAELMAAGATYAELDRRAKRLGEWLDVQSRLASARTNVDRLNGYVRDALEGLKKPETSALDIARSRAKLEAVMAQWDDDCRQDLAELNQLLLGCTSITQPDSGSAAALAKSSIEGWAEALDKVQQESQALFGQDMTVIADEALKATCIALDNQGRQLRDWLRDHDNDCRNRLISEAKELTHYTDRLCHPNRAPR